MISELEAREVAERALSEVEEESGIRIAIFDGEFGVSGVVDRGDVWLVNWNSVEYLQSGNVLDKILAGPILVPKDGSKVTMLGTAVPVEEGLERWRKRKVSRAPQFYCTYYIRADGTQVNTGLFRRERADDITGDAVFQRDGRWHSTGAIAMSLKGYSDTDLREVSEAEALDLLEKGFGVSGSKLHAPMVVDGRDV